MASLSMYIDNKYRTQQMVPLLNFLKGLHNIPRMLALSAFKFSWEYLEIKPLRGNHLNQKNLLSD